jgi:beta-glucosidase
MMNQSNDSAPKESLDYISKAKAFLGEMTLEEKASLMSGDGWWHTHRIERLGIPAISIFDGPHGLRKVEGGGLPTSVPATCFPTASALASSWNTELMRHVGEGLAEECQANDVQILLGPGVNMKRSPLGGRNFEYFSEDPVLAGKMAAAYIQGVQSKGVGTSLKHYAANNQEFERMATSSNVDERTLREIYLPPFEIAVKEAQPWSVMAAYNLVNNIYATESRVLLQGILRDEWGFQGFVVSDWGAMHDGVSAVNAGLSLEMPGSGNYHPSKIVEAVRSGKIPDGTIDNVLAPLLAVILKANDQRKVDATFRVENNYALARRAAAESIVLLKNQNSLLPLNFQQQKAIAVIGAFAKKPRYQGAGSSQVNATCVTAAYDEIANLIGNHSYLKYADGYTEDGTTTDALISEAVEQARSADIAILFVGLPGSYECEGVDRSSLDLPIGHNLLIESVAAAQQKVVIVLMNGSAVTMPWVDSVPAIVEAWLGGQAGGGAIADVLSGRENPSGKLSESFPARLEDTPCFPDFPGRNKQANYGEGIFIGYRHYDSRKRVPLFPFGFGMSYTTFAYSNLNVTPITINDKQSVLVSFTIKNSGPMAGKEIAQLYVREQNAKVVRPEKELKGFHKVALEPGEETTLSFELQKRDFAYFDMTAKDWVVNPGTFEIMVCASSTDVRLKQSIEVQSTDENPMITRDSLLKEVRKHPKGQSLYNELVEGFDMGNPDELDMAVRAFLEDMPIYKVCAFSEGRFSEEKLDKDLKKLQ